jgi:hypothetical protein
MSDEQPWERQEDEQNNHYEMFLFYLHLGPSRTKLGAVHEAEKSRKKQTLSKKVPGNWNDVYEQWNWRKRAETYDEYRRKQVFTQGNAYDLARIEKLNKYSERLEQELDKMLDSLPKTIKKPWFNHFMYEKYLQSLEALAQETGGRIRTTKQEVSGSVDITGAKELLKQRLEQLEQAHDE